MTQHTPGPWVIRGPDRLAICQGDYYGTFVAEANRAQNSRAQANARLIAAAPDMLAALQAIRSGVISGAVGGEDVVWFDEITTLYEFCDEIIARATGAGEARESR